MDINSLYTNIDISSIIMYGTIGIAIVVVICHLLKDILVEKDIKFGGMNEREAILKHRDDFNLIKRRKNDSDENEEFFSITEENYQRALEKAEAEDETGYTYDEDDTEEAETTETEIVEPASETSTVKKSIPRDARSRQQAHSRYRGRR